MNGKTFLLFLLIPAVGGLDAQGLLPGIDMPREQKTSSPGPFDFTEAFKSKKTTREDFLDLKRQETVKLTERFTPKASAERAVDPRQYRVGPGDMLSFNIWGVMEMQIPLTVNPEGKLLVPSVGEIPVDGLSLAEVQDRVVAMAKMHYEKSAITLTLETMRTFRVHVVGEVEYPGTYIAQAVYRVSEMVTESGGFTDVAWNRAVQLRCADGKIDTLDMALFEGEGKLTEDPYVNGGDVIYVPSTASCSHSVFVEGDHDAAGTYPITLQEPLQVFLKNQRLLDKNTDLTKIAVVRRIPGSKTVNHYRPFVDGTDGSFFLVNGDRIVLPSKFVYVRGVVQKPGAYPFAINLTAGDYAGMAGTLGGFDRVQVFHVFTGKHERGVRVLVEAGDVVNVPSTWGQRMKDYLGIASTVTSLIIAAKAVGW